MEREMAVQRVKFQRFGSMAIGLLLTGLTAGLSIDVVRDFIHPARAQPAQTDKHQLALWGGLELERAVQALKDCILRGDSAYSAEFDRHMEEVERAAFLYGATEPLDWEERETLRKLQQVVPQYRAAIYTVDRMRGRNASISEIDAAVKGADRPVSAAFDQLQTETSERISSRTAALGEAAGVLLCAALAAFFLYFALANSSLSEQSAEGVDRSLRELSMRMMQWHDERDAKAFSVLHDGVCQSLSAVMYLLKSGESLADKSNASFRSLLEPIIPALQGAIRETRAIALNLGPPRLHECGLREALDPVWRDCQVRRPDIGVVPRTLVEEGDVPEELKQVIVRIAGMASDWAVQEPALRQLWWELKREQDQIRMSVQLLFAIRAGDLGSSARRSQEPPSDLPDAIRARVILSGGASDGVCAISGGLALNATWPLVAPLSR
jgi:hypothetical protein